MILAKQIFALHFTVRNMYSKVSIIRPGCSRRLEFEKKIVLIVNREFFKKSRPGRLIESKQVNK